MQGLVSCLLAGLVLTSSVALEDPLENDEIIQAVNSARTTWTAGRNFARSVKKSYGKKLLGVLKPAPGAGPRFGAPDRSKLRLTDVPSAFDARTAWANCSTISAIVDQGACGSCWAVAAASAFSDRLCVATSGKFSKPLSAESIMSCCDYCGYGCDGGLVGYTWSYLQETGIVTGGAYQSQVGCQPYTLPPCNHSAAEGGLSEDWMKACTTEDTTPGCKQKCYNRKYKTKWDHDFHEVSDFFMCSVVSEAQLEIYNNGPIETSFDVYEDFFSYKSGIYQYTTGDYLGGHAVKIVGWGSENGTDYWIVANSWNKGWGEDGFFRFIRGSNDCNFELEMVGGYPITS